jgi:hypothetical protein
MSREGRAADSNLDRPPNTRHTIRLRRTLTALAVAGLALPAAALATTTLTVPGNQATYVSGTGEGTKNMRCTFLVGINWGAPHAYITCKPGRNITIQYSVAGHASHPRWFGFCSTKAQLANATMHHVFYSGGRTRTDITFKGTMAANGLHCQVNHVTFTR